MKKLDKIINSILKVSIGKIAEELIIRTLYCNEDFYNKEIGNINCILVNKNDDNDCYIYINGIKLNINIDEDFEEPLILVDHYKISEYEESNR